MRTRHFQSQEVYVWELPVRIYHWVNAICITILVVTGYLIGDPPAFMTVKEASFNYWFGAVRFIHFTTAFVFFFNFLFRIYWGFTGNEFSRWYNYFPLKKCQWKEIADVLKADIFLVKKKEFDSIGHNSLASLIYFITFLLFLFQCLTGFGMYAAMSTFFFPKMFAWIVPVFGGDATTRLLHHLNMWAFIIFAVIHVYLVFYHDYTERRGITSSMVNGWKYISDDLAEKHDKELKECPKGF